MDVGPLLKVGMAIDNDDLFVIRLKAACALTGVEYNRTLGLQIASYVTDQIDILDGPSVLTQRVDDARILEALSEIDENAVIEGLNERFSDPITLVQK